MRTHPFPSDAAPVHEGRSIARCGTPPLPVYIGDRLVLDGRDAEVVVEDFCAGCVCCGWTENGVHRRVWVPEERLEATVTSTRPALQRGH